MKHLVRTYYVTGKVTSTMHLTENCLEPIQKDVDWQYEEEDKTIITLEDIEDCWAGKPHSPKLDRQITCTWKGYSAPKTLRELLLMVLDEYVDDEEDNYDLDYNDCERWMDEW